MSTKPLYHVAPPNDLREHESSMLCPCLPIVRYGVCVHNSYDRREVGEVCRRALHTLASALGHENHDWTECEFELLDHAVELLNMHWPASPEGTTGDDEAPETEGGGA